MFVLCSWGQMLDAVNVGPEFGPGSNANGPGVLPGTLKHSPVYGKNALLYEAYMTPKKGK